MSVALEMPAVMPSTSAWDLRPLAEVADILDSKRVPVNGKEREGRRGTFPYYGATGQVGWIDDWIFDEELVLLGEDGAPFLDASKPKAYPVRGKTWVNNHAHVLRATGVPAGWLLHYLNAIDYRDLVTGTTRLKLTQGEMRKIQVPVAPQRVMREVVAEIEKQFSRLDEAVANLQRVKANLKRYRAGMLDVLFGDEPKARLGDVIESGPQNGLYLPKSAYGTGSPILRIDDYQTDWIRPTGELRRVAASEAQVATWALREGDLVINRVNSISHLGKCASVPASLAGALFESNMMRVGLKASAVPRYVELYLGGALGRRRLTQQAKWAVNQASINQQDVMATPVPLPDVDMQRRIVAEVDRRLSIVREVEAEIDANMKRAQAMRQSVLARAFQHR